MATFGQGINAQLGAIDYSPIQRGSAVGAQLAAQGGQMIGEGLAQGIQQYTKKKEERDMYTAGIESKMGRIVSAMKDFAANPAAYNNVPPVSQEELNTYTTNAQKAIGGSIGAQKSFYAEVASLEDRVQQAPAKALQFIQLRAAQEQERLRPEVAKYISERTNGPKNDIMDGAMSFTPVSAEAQNAAEKQMLESRYMQSQINKNDADRPTGTAPTEYVRWTNNWLNNWSAENQNQKPTAAAIAQADQAWKTSNQPAVPNPVESSIFNDLLVDRKPLQQAINASNDDKIIKLLDSKELFTGSTATSKLVGAKLLKAAGFTNFDNEIANTEQLAALLVRPTIALAKQLGTNPTDYDAKLIAKAEAGDIVFDDVTIRALAKAREDIIAAGIKQHNERIDSVYSPKNPDYARQNLALKLRRDGNILIPLSDAARAFLPNK